MLTKLFAYTCAASLLLIAGCDRHESAADTERDVTSARQEATQDVTKARQEATSEVVEAQRKADENMNKVTAASVYDVAIAEATAARKIATEKCDALAGDAQTDCKKRADQDLDAAKERAARQRDQM